MNLLNTTEAAQRLGVSARRVLALIEEGKLKAQKVGRDYAIEADALEGVKVYGKAGRPPKVKSGKTAHVPADQNVKTTKEAILKLSAKKGAEERRRRNDTVNGLLSDRKAAQESERATKKGGKK